MEVLFSLCGTGIEDCVGHGISCRQDPRNKWRGFLMEIDSEGEQLWYRTDSYYFEGETESCCECIRICDLEQKMEIMPPWSTKILGSV